VRERGLIQQRQIARQDQPGGLGVLRLRGERPAMGPRFSCTSLICAKRARTASLRWSARTDTKARATCALSSAMARSSCVRPW